jgi:pimeloyl-ACP methyl ester carboxylesterase
VTCSVRTDGLDMAYEEHGPPEGDAVILLHGFPYDVRAYDEVAPAVAADGCRVIVPWLRGFGETRFHDHRTPRSGQQGALGHDLRALMDALGIARATLVGYDWGGRAACIVAALWPERASGLVTCGTSLAYNIQDIAAANVPASPEQERRSWYQYLFQIERGRAALEQDRDGLCELLWRLWSPTWEFSDETFARTAASFTNPDFVDVVIHSYRHRYANADGDPEFAAIEERLAAQPVIDVPTVALMGGDDGVDPPTNELPDRFSRLVGHRVVEGAGHNLPQEAPSAVVDAIRELPGSRAPVV